MLTRTYLKPTALKTFKRTYSKKAEKKKIPILVIGGGTAGLGISHILAKTNEVLIVDPAEKHYYQPGWTLVGGGLFDIEKTARPMSSLVPKGAELMKDAVEKIDPENNLVVTKGGVEIEYGSLFVCAGLQTNWGEIKGLEEALVDPESRVCSNYSYHYAPKTAKLVEGLKKGNAIFTQAAGVTKCAGAPQKIMYIADSKFKESKRNTSINVKFFSGLPFIFGVPHYRPTLEALLEERGIDTNFGKDLVEIDAQNFEAIFKDINTGELSKEKYSMLHVAPKMSAPDFIKNSPLANEAGFVDVDNHTLQHVRYPNVWSAGDASSCPTSKTASAVAGQIGVASSNFLSWKHGVEFTESYDGYTACPLVTQKGKAILAEFNYKLEPAVTFPLINERKQSTLNYILKRHILPPLYWHGLIKGRWRGPKQLPWKRFASNH